MGEGEIVYFLDSYALFEIWLGNPAYAKYSSGRLVTTALNVMEFHYGLLKKYDLDNADVAAKKYIRLCIGFDYSQIRNASMLKSKNRLLSYIDCLGYSVAMSKNARFLTGDNGFKSMKNVEFVK